MRRLLTIWIVCLILSCDRNSVPNSTIRVVELKNNLGSLTFALPNSFDTTYKWTNFSDNRGDATELFRFANKKYALKKESGFFTIGGNYDSLYQVTIVQDKYLENRDTNLRINADYLQHRIQVITENQPDENPDLKIIKINHRDFVVETSQKKLNSKENRYLSVSTIIDGQTLGITYQCLANNCDSFIEKMKLSLMSIQIK